jgi:hypothetical protein
VSLKVQGVGLFVVAVGSFGLGIGAGEAAVPSTSVKNGKRILDFISVTIIQYLQRRERIRDCS